MISYDICFYLSDLTSLSMTLPRSIHVVANGIIFFFMAESTVYMHHIFFIHSSVDEHVGCSHVLAIVNSAGIKTLCVCLFELWLYLDIRIGVELLGHIGSSIFSFLRNLQTVLHSCFRYKVRLFLNFSCFLR